MIPSALLLPERFPGRTIAAVGFVLAFGYLAGAAAFRKPDGRLIVGDAVHYYVYVRSVVFDHDLQFRNDYIRMYGLRGGEADTGWIYQPTATGHVRNVMPIGPALMWTPLFLAAAAITVVMRAAGASIEVDGYSTPFQVSAALSGIVAATAGAWLTYKLCAFVFDRRVAIWSTLAVWIGSSALYYSLVSPAYSHAASMCAASLFFYVWGRTIGDTRLSRFAKVGACAGVAALVRWQDVVFLIAPLTELCLTTPRRSAVRAFAPIAVSATAAAIVFIPQTLVWLVLYGTPFTVPQGGEFMKWTQPALARVLFSDWHGLFSWTPIAAVGVLGLLAGLRGGPQLAIDRVEARVLLLGALAAFLASWYVNAAVADWWAGEAFGARRFVSCFPVFALGVTAIAHRLAKRPAAAVALLAALCISNLLLLVQYELFMHGRRAPYPGGIYGMTVERFVVPIQLAAAWLRR